MTGPAIVIACALCLSAVIGVYAHVLYLAGHEMDEAAKEIALIRQSEQRTLGE